ncbi:Replicase RepFR55 [Bacillus sp. BP-3]|uniref:Replicase RepFR55 n=1 Tax=Bacillus sp. BP-3 TaxID=3022773 RepID=UPI00232A85D8|nr:Replicase RepFR55 [Bacillus sp. BP-3]MDC2867330.1 Replicase RepFR55 [Bacillus sp. BP-3]
MILQNFLLSRAKVELSPRIKHLSKTPGAINQAIKEVITYIDKIVLEYEGITANEFLTKRKYEALETILSYLVQEGYSQVRQERISKKSGISRPVINYIFNWLEDLEICQQIKVRRHGKIAPSVYILTIHNNYLKIIEYFKVKWALAIDICSTFTRFLKEKIFKKTAKTNHEDIESNPPMSSSGLNIFSIEEPNRKQDLEDFLSGDQKKTYRFITSQPVTYLTEQDAYTIALRMPKDIDCYQRWDFEKCVEWFQHNQAEISNPAHFMKMFFQKSKQRKERMDHKLQELDNTKFGEERKNKVQIYDWLNDPKMDTVLQKLKEF